MRDGRTNKQTTSEDRATQLLICEALSLAKMSLIYISLFQNKTMVKDKTDGKIGQKHCCHSH